MRVVVCDSNFQCPDEFKGTGPLLQPQAFFFERTHHPLGSALPLGVVVVAGEGLLNSQGTASLHESLRGQLAAVVTLIKDKA
jgi:hypothetical protein